MNEYATDRPSSASVSLNEMGDCYVAVGDFERARQCYQEASIRNPRQVGPFVGLGALALQEGTLPEAIRFFRIARALDPLCKEAVSGLAMAYHQQGDYPRAFDLYLEFLERDGDNLTALLGLFQTSCQMGTFAKIIYYLEHYLRSHPDDTAVQFCLASLYAREGKLVKARDLTMAVLRAEPDKAEAVKLLLQIEESLKAPAGVLWQ